MTRLSRALPPVYAAGALRLLVPVIVLPIMSARLGADEFGRLSFILVWAGLMATLFEGGFLAAATRLAVVADAARRWRIAQQVFTARCALGVPAAVLTVVIVAGLPGDRPHGLADGVAVALLAACLGWPATWYLQATQQLARWARVELAVFSLLILACWAFAHSTAAYVGLYFAASSALALIGWRRLVRDLAPAASDALWSRDALRPGLRLGWSMLPVSIAGAAYSFALPAAASARMPQAELGLYFLADRFVRAVLSAAEPVLALVYPRMLGLFEQGARVALRYAVRWAVGGALCGLAIILIGMLMWPLVEPILLTRAIVADAMHLRHIMLILGLLLPLLLAWKFIGYWMLGSARFDNAYRSAMILGGIFGVAGAWLFGGMFGAVGLAWTAVSVELLVIAIAVTGVWISRTRRAV